MKLIIISALITVCVANPQIASQVQQSSSINTDGSYSFSFDNNRREGRQFRDETRNADGTVVGKYGFQDPTGQLRVVEYTAGKDGFIASGDDINVQQPAGVGVGVPVLTSVIGGQPIVWNNNPEQQASIVGIDTSLQYANKPLTKTTVLSNEQQKSQVEEDNEEVKVKVQQQSEPLSDRDDTFPQVLSGQRRLTDPVVDITKKKVVPQSVDTLLSSPVYGVISGQPQVIYQSVPLVQQQTVPVLQQQSIPLVHQQTGPVVQPVVQQQTVQQTAPLVNQQKHTSLLSSLISVPVLQHQVVREVKHHQLDHDNSVRSQSVPQSVPQSVGHKQVVHTLVHPLVQQVWQQPRDQQLVHQGVQQVVQPIVHQSGYATSPQLIGVDQQHIQLTQPFVQQIGELTQSVIQSQPLDSNVDQRQVYQLPQSGVQSGIQYGVQYGVQPGVQSGIQYGVQYGVQPGVQSGVNVLANVDQRQLQPSFIQQSLGLSGLDQRFVSQSNVGHQLTGQGLQSSVVQPVRSVPLVLQTVGNLDQRRTVQQGVQYQQLVPLVDRNDGLEERVVVQPQQFSRVKLVDVPLSSVYYTNPWTRLTNVGLTGNNIPLRQSSVQLLSDGVPQQTWISQQYPLTGISQSVSSPLVSPVRQQVTRPTQQVYQLLVQPYVTSSGQLVQPLQYSGIQDMTIRRADDSGIVVKPDDGMKSVVVMDGQTDPKPALYSHQLATKSVAV